MAAKIKRCARCSRRLRGAGTDWAAALELDNDDHLRTVTEVYCPECTTSEEHITREINDATTDYRWVGDHVVMWPKVAAAN